MILFYIGLSISIIIVSWTVGLIVNIVLKKRAFYSKISHLNFISSDKINAVIGVKLLKLFLVKSFWRKLNPTLNIRQAANLNNLLSLKEEIISSEIVHLAAFVTICATAIALKVTGFYTQMIYPLLVMNVIMNLYPVLVQQYNKRRIIKMIGVLSNNTLNTKVPPSGVRGPRLQPRITPE